VNSKYYHRAANVRLIFPIHGSKHVILRDRISAYSNLHDDSWWPFAPMDRLARNLDDLRKIVLHLTRKGVHVQFVKENLIFTGEDSPMSNLLLSLLGAVAEFERSMIRERQREGIALAKKTGVYKGRKPSQTSTQVAEIRKRVGDGEKKAGLAAEYRISRQTLYAALGSPLSGCAFSTGELSMGKCRVVPAVPCPSLCWPLSPSLPGRRPTSARGTWGTWIATKPR
jgi:hypothetical protein